MTRVRSLLHVMTALAAASCGSTQPAAPTTPETPPPVQPSAVPPAPPAPSVHELAFRDAVHAPPPDWTGPVFKLSHDYPTAAVECAAPWLDVDVDFAKRAKWDKKWARYTSVLKDVLSKGQEPNLADDVGFKVAPEGETLWYHVPWMAYDGTVGREFAHGLTNELVLPLAEYVGRGSGAHSFPHLGVKGGLKFETWSVGVYNRCGGYAIGQGWATGEPQVTTDPAGKRIAKGMPFPKGSMVAKLLFSTAEPDHVPFLKGSAEWTANAHVQTGPGTFERCARAPRKVRLVQVDIAVVDERSPTRWLYTTFAYDGSLPGKTVWERLTPVGVQWGNDPQSWPAVERAKSKPLAQSALAPIPLFEHYGCANRLAGALDQTNSSCMSCHIAAFAAGPGELMKLGDNVPNPFGFQGICSNDNLQGNAEYFSNYPYPQTYPGGRFPDAIALDTSLQLAVAWTQYAVHKNQATQPPPPCPNAGQ